MEPFSFGMVSMLLNYIRAQAGGDEVLFVKGEDLSEEKLLEQALEMLRLTGGRELGLIYPAQGDGHLKVRIIDLTKEGFIEMCGGLTQCLGKILGESKWIELGKNPLHEGANEILLETDGGQIPMEVFITGNRVSRVITDMTPYLRSCYQRGVSLIPLANLTMVSVGISEAIREFLVLDMKELQEEYGFNPRSFGEEEEALLTKLYYSFFTYMNLPPDHLYGALYWLTSPTEALVLFPFYPWDGKGVTFACGTGSTAIAIALHKRGLLPKERELELTHQVGVEGGGPRTTLFLKGGEELTHLRFSHEPLEIMEENQLLLQKKHGKRR